jgi:pimeloyl-ACP methyl ester carboxylesterase
MSHDPTGRTTNINGAEIYFEEHGHGTPLVLVHGGLGAGAEWSPLIPTLADNFRVITPDSRGHGRSTNPATTLSYAALADDLAGLIAALELDPDRANRVDVAGLSRTLTDPGRGHRRTRPGACR